MANLITLCRLLLLLVVIVVIYFGSPLFQLLDVLLLILVFVTDGLDGYVARKYHEESLFGAIFDIAADRIVELCLWIVFAHIGLIPVWIPIVFVARGIMTDAIRAAESETSHRTPFASMQSRFGKAIVAGRFMRGFYAVLKAVTFCALLLILPASELMPELWANWGDCLSGAALWLAYLCVFINILRGAPVIIEFIAAQKGNP